MISKAGNFEPPNCIVALLAAAEIEKSCTFGNGTLDSLFLCSINKLDSVRQIVLYD